MNKRMVLTLASSFALSFLAGVPGAFPDGTSMHQNEIQAAPAQDKAYKCEVVDVKCYIDKGAHGDAHQGCAAKCISEGGELALLYNGNLYVPVDSNFHPARKQFVTKGGESVVVKGHLVSKGGLNYLQLAK